MDILDKLDNMLIDQESVELIVIQEEVENLCVLISNNNGITIDEAFEKIKRYIELLKKEIEKMKKEGMDIKEIKFKLKQMGFNNILIDMQAI